MNPIVIYDFIDVAYPYRLRGAGNQQSDTGLIYPQLRHTLFSVAGDGSTPSSTQSAEGAIALGGFSIHNRCGTTAAVGIGIRIPNAYWQAGQWTDSGTTYTDDTTDAQDAGTTDFSLETTTTSDGFVILSRVPFNAITIQVSVASTGGNPVRALRYSTSSGGTSAWSGAITNAYAAAASTGHYAVTGTTNSAEALWVWNLPNDFAATTGANDALGTGIDAGWYAVNIRATTAPTGTAGVADFLSIYRLHFLTEALADNGVYEAFFGTSEIPLHPQGDALVAFFETANDGNRVSALVRAKG